MLTEGQWLACAEAEPMIEMVFVAGASPVKGSTRKQRLFACACARRAWRHLEDRRTRKAIKVAEKRADGIATAGETNAAVRGCYAAIEAAGRAGKASHAAACVADSANAQAPYEVAYAVLRLVETLACSLVPAPSPAEGRAARRRESAAQADLLRELFGNPFRPVSVPPAWVTSHVASLARASYDERILRNGGRDPARLAALSDALEDAGCSEAAILDHLRSPGPHVRGCWVVDHILGLT